jgi:hypothetical protein
MTRAQLPLSSPLLIFAPFPRSVPWLLEGWWEGNARRALVEREGGQVLSRRDGDGRLTTSRDVKDLDREDLDHGWEGLLLVLKGVNEVREWAKRGEVASWRGGGDNCFFSSNRLECPCTALLNHHWTNPNFFHSLSCYSPSSPSSSSSRSPAVSFSFSTPSNDAISTSASSEELNTDLDVLAKFDEVLLRRCWRGDMRG